MMRFLELWPVLIIGLLGLLPVLRVAATQRRAAAPLVVLLALVVAGVAAGMRAAHLTPPTPESVPRRVRDQGYVSSAECRACHPSQFDSWHHSYHRTMTQVVRRDTLAAPRGNETVENTNGRYHFAWHSDELWVTIDDDGWWQQAADAVLARVPGELSAVAELGRSKHQPRRVVMSTGSHNQHGYWIPIGQGRTAALCQLPIMYQIAEGRFLPDSAVFLRPPDLPTRRFAMWSTNCVYCHSTGGQPGLVTNDTRVGELGISCEACHGPADEHTRANRDPARRYRWHHSGAPDPTIVNPARLDKQAAAEICGRCHSFSYMRVSERIPEFGVDYQPGQGLEPDLHVQRLEEGGAPGDDLESKFWPDGTARVGGREFNNMTQSACYERGQLTCLTCHSMHAAAPNDQLTAAGQTNENCLSCHLDYRERIAEHTHHPIKSAGSLCYNCHMPHTSYALHKAIRNHRIDSPVVDNTVGARMNACNLCHLDRTLAWTAEWLDKWYGRKSVTSTDDDRELAVVVRWLLEGNAAQRIVTAWHLGWQPAREASGDDWVAPYLAELLVDPYEAIRFVAQRQLARFGLDSHLSYDFLASAPERTTAAQRLIQTWELQPSGARRTDAELLLGVDGHVDRQAWQEHLGRRDNRAVHIEE
ncbi:MAG: hypothetical protein K2Y37_07970 [Pirellulales bacterium]|nr:hypothetical protein [Pirellulales bacterium]